MSLLSEADAKRVGEAVAEAESITAGELVTMVVARSDDYGATRGVLALLLSLGAAHELHFFFPELAFSLLLGALGLVCVGFYFLFAAGPFIRLAVSSSRRDERVMQRALRAFAEEGVTNTRDRSGVLIFVSEAEHRVVILADQGINERVEPDEWQKDVEAIAAAIRQGRVAEGLLQAIDRIGGILAEAFPPRSDDENELSNEVRRG